MTGWSVLLLLVDYTIYSKYWSVQLLGVFAFCGPAHIIPKEVMMIAMRERPIDPMAMRPIGKDPFRSASWTEKNLTPPVGVRETFETTHLITE
jgi:hypothetical protein